MLSQVEAIAAQRQALGVSSITLRIGPLSGIEADLLQHAFPLARAGTVAADARLIIERLPIRVRCEQCGAETDATVNRLLCGACGDWHTQLISGDELVLASVELLT
jgi:hydrogenase nickel incorporation protein HypA/HybF